MGELLAEKARVAEEEAVLLGKKASDAEEEIKRLRMCVSRVCWVLTSLDPRLLHPRLAWENGLVEGGNWSSHLSGKFKQLSLVDTWKIQVVLTGFRAGAVAWALASHQCGPGSIPRLGVICGLSLLVLYSAPRGFLRVLRFPLSSKTNIWLDLCQLFISIYSVPY